MGRTVSITDVGGSIKHETMTNEIPYRNPVHIIIPLLFNINRHISLKAYTGSIQEEAPS